MTCETRRDLVCGSSAVLLWYAPTVLIVVGAFVPSLRAALWIPSFAIMGIACLVNARGCGRLHCYITGPLFLFASLASALDAFAILTVSWQVIFLGAAIGTVGAYGLEWVRGRYVGTSRVSA